MVFASDLGHAIQLELLSIDPPGMGGGDMAFHFAVLSTGSHGGAVPEPGTMALLVAGALVGWRAMGGAAGNPGSHALRGNEDRCW